MNTEISIRREWFQGRQSFVVGEAIRVFSEWDVSLVCSSVAGLVRKFGLHEWRGVIVRDEMGRPTGYQLEIVKQ